MILGFFSVTSFVRNKFKNRPLLRSIAWTTVLLGLLFFIFAWVPYKQQERQLKLLEQKAVQITGGFQEARNLLSVIISEPSSLNQAGVTYRLRNQTEASSRIIKMIDGIPLAVREEKKEIDSLPALIFYPGFSKKIKKELDFEIDINEEKMQELKNIIQTNLEINKALLNISIFDLDTYLDRPLSRYDKRELTKKLNSLNESIGATELSISRLDNSLDKRVNKVLAIVKSEHKKVLSIISAVAANNYQKAESDKNELYTSLASIRISLGSWNANLLENSLDEEYLQMLDRIIKTQNSLIENIKEIQEKYF